MRVESRVLPLKTDSGYPKDAGLALVCHTGKTGEFSLREILSSSGSEATVTKKHCDGEPISSLYECPRPATVTRTNEKT